VNRAVSILVFDFATGIRVSVPTAVLATVTRAARQNVLIKGGRALENLAALDTVVFDKTGTLTTGSPRVLVVHPTSSGISKEQIIGLAAAAECRLTHPAAIAIVQAAEAQRVHIPDRGDSRYVVGQGVEAEVDGHTVLVGSRRFLTGAGVAIPAAASTVVNQAGRRGASVLFVAQDGQTIGVIVTADTVRPEAADVVRQLRARGIQRVIMLTGDHVHAARAAASQVGIDQVEAGVFPERKVAIVHQLQESGHVVGMIGDGINDSPALAYADVSFSLKAGTDVARETADVVLHGDLSGMVYAIDLARTARGIIRQNIALAAAPNLAGMLAAGAGLVGPAAATALNNGSAIAAAMNGLRPLVAHESSSAL
jgi:Cu2+-exporting ATPase